MVQRIPVELRHRGATGSVNSLSPLGERVGVRGLRMSIDYRESETPHPTPLPSELGFTRVGTLRWPKSDISDFGREREQTEPAATLCV
jgi:hypothetical protein